MIAAVVLASGFSRRMGQSKLTLAVGGRTLLERALDAVSGAAPLGQRLIVLQPEDLHLLDRTQYPTVEPLANPLAAEGQSAAIRLATAQLAADPGVAAVVFSVVDQPFLQPTVFERLAQAWAEGDGEILVSSYDGRRGNPVLFGRRFFSELQALQGDVGGREILRAHPGDVREVAMPEAVAGQDVDTWEDLQAAQAQAQVAGERL
jgi:molybdenum cofactor cytidylyltransferase